MTPWNTKSKRGEKDVEIDLHEEAFNKQKPLPKKEVMKLEAGTILQLKWKDSPNTIALLLAKPEYEAGDVSLHVLDDTMRVTRQPVHSQVVSAHARLTLSTVHEGLTSSNFVKYEELK